MLALAWRARRASLLTSFCCVVWLGTACGGGPEKAADDDPADNGDVDDQDGEKPDTLDGGKRDAGSIKADGGGKGDAGSAASDAGGTKLDAGGAKSDAGTGASTGCGANMLPLPDDMKARGPWDVGVRTLKIGRLTVEAFYPAQPGSAAGKPEATYDISKFLPAREQPKIPDDHSPDVTAIGGHVYRDLPLDNDHGPYPVVVFIHGTASFRVASATTNVHWASRGMVVLAADFPGLGLADQLSATLECGLPTSGAQDLPGDVKLQLDALKTPSGETEFLKGHVDMTRVGISGHSQGACIAATLSSDPGVRIVIPLDGSNPTAASSSLESVMYISGMDDTVIGYSLPLIGNVVCPIGSVTTSAAYDGSPTPPKVKKRLVGITGGGHLVPTDLCQKNAQGKNAIEEAAADGVCGINSAVIIGLPALFDCGKIDWKLGLEAVDYASTAALEETLLCQDRTAQFADLRKNLPQVGDFKEAVK